jgi:hypothetical protein
VADKIVNNEDADRIGHLRWLVLVGVSTEAVDFSCWVCGESC